MKRVGWIFAVIIWSVLVTQAQETCPVLEQQALVTTLQSCFELSENRACYGNNTLTATARSDDVMNFLFRLPGDRMDILEIDTLRASLEDETWGVSLIRLQAYPLDSWAAQQVTMLVFGDVLIKNAGDESTSILTATGEITASAGANVRVQPSTEYRILQPLTLSDPIKATGRLADDSWIRILLRDGETGWVFGASVAGEFVDLPIVGAEDKSATSLYRPLQQFTFNSGFADAACDDVPESGILLQTESREPALIFKINGVDITLAGTLYLQSHPDIGMIVNVIEGEATVEALGVRRQVTAGFRTVVPIMEDAETPQPEAPPIEPEAYKYERMLTLPIKNLPREMFIGLELSTILTPRPAGDVSPLEGMLLDEPCKITVGPDGANLRTGPGTDYPIRGVMSYRQSIEPEARAFSSDGSRWWKLIEGVWLSVAVTVTGGDCVSVPTVSASD